MSKSDSSHLRGLFHIGRSKPEVVAPAPPANIIPADGQTEFIQAVSLVNDVMVFSRSITLPTDPDPKPWSGKHPAEVAFDGWTQVESTALHAWWTSNGLEAHSSGSYASLMPLDGFRFRSKATDVDSEIPPLISAVLSHIRVMTLFRKALYHFRMKSAPAASATYRVDKSPTNLSEYALFKSDMQRHSYSQGRAVIGNISRWFSVLVLSRERVRRLLKVAPVDLEYQKMSNGNLSTALYSAAIEQGESEIPTLAAFYCPVAARVLHLLGQHAVDGVPAIDSSDEYKGWIKQNCEIFYRACGDLRAKRPFEFEPTPVDAEDRAYFESDAAAPDAPQPPAYSS